MNLSHALAWIDSQAPNLLETVERWARINSGSEHLAGLDRMRAELRQDFSRLGPCEEVPLPEQRVALRLRMRAQADKRVLLGGHYDTVFGESHPFQAVRREGELLRGPGVADMKGGLCVMLTALEAFERHGGDASALGWSVVLNPDEELGSPWSRGLWAEEAKMHQLGLLVEPALPGGRLARSRKGSGHFAVTVHGRAAHAGRDPHLGRNAVVALADFIRAIDALNDGRDGIVVNVARVEGGGAVNIVPDRASARYNVRTVRADDEEWMRDCVTDILTDMNARDGIRVEVSGEFASPPKPATRESDAMLAELQQCARELGFEVGLGNSGGASDGNKLAASGLTNIDNLGPCGGGLHSDDEHILIASLAERSKLLARYLFKLAGA